MPIDTSHSPPCQKSDILRTFLTCLHFSLSKSPFLSFCFFFFLFANPPLLQDISSGNLLFFSPLGTKMALCIGPRREVKVICGGKPTIARFSRPRTILDLTDALRYHLCFLLFLIV
ncbi:hypothetical protein BDV09DRAFT_120730 [Aspergillus tetrazonus]